MKKVVALLVVIVMLSSGCSWFKKPAHEAVNIGVSKLIAVRKMNSSILVNGTIISPPGEKPSKITINLEAEGKTDVTNNEAPMSDMKLKFTIAADDQKGSGDVLFRTVGGKLYFNVQTIDIGGPAGAELKTQLASLLNKWWSLPLGQGNTLSKLSEEQKRLDEKFKDRNFFTNVREEGEEEVHGMTTTRYRVDVDKEVVKQFIVDIAQSEGNQISAEEQKAIGEGLDDVEFSGNVWVGSDSAIHRIKGTVTSQPVEGASSSFEIDYTGWDYGDKVTIETPEGASEFNSLVMLPLLSIFNSLETAPEEGVIPPVVPGTTPKAVTPAPGTAPKVAPVPAK